MLDRETTDTIGIKVAIALSKLLNENKEYNKKYKMSEKYDIVQEVNDSYEKIGADQDIRKATVSNAFNSNGDTLISTLFSIIDGMDKTIETFGRIYDQITEEEIIDFIRKKKRKAGRGRKKKQPGA